MSLLSQRLCCNGIDKYEYNRDVLRESVLLTSSEKEDHVSCVTRIIRSFIPPENLQGFSSLLFDSICKNKIKKLFD